MSSMPGWDIGISEPYLGCSGGHCPWPDPDVRPLCSPHRPTRLPLPRPSRRRSSLSSSRRLSVLRDWEQHLAHRRHPVPVLLLLVPPRCCLPPLPAPTPGLGFHPLAHSLWHTAFGTQPLAHSLWHTAFSTQPLAHSLWHTAFGTQPLAHSLWLVIGLIGRADWCQCQWQVRDRQRAADRLDK